MKDFNYCTYGGLSHRSRSKPKTIITLIKMSKKEISVQKLTESIIPNPAKVLIKWMKITQNKLLINCVKTIFYLINTKR